MHAKRHRPALLLAAMAVLTGVLGGCTAASNREAYFDARAAQVPSQPGSGASRVALWPGGAWNQASVADANDRTRADVRLGVTSGDSAR
jgi:hypothetical protein